MSSNRGIMEWICPLKLETLIIIQKENIYSLDSSSWCKYNDSYTLDFCVNCDILYTEIRSFFSPMTKKEKPRGMQYAKDRMEYFREFHRVIAPVVVLKKDE